MRPPHVPLKVKTFIWNIFLWNALFPRYTFITLTDSPYIQEDLWSAIIWIYLPPRNVVTSAIPGDCGESQITFGPDIYLIDLPLFSEILSHLFNHCFVLDIGNWDIGNSSNTLDVFSSTWSQNCILKNLVSIFVSSLISKILNIPMLLYKMKDHVTDTLLSIKF